MLFGKKEKEQFDKETRCWICSEKFVNDFKNGKVRDHCHFTGRYRGAADRICNLKYRKPNFTPVVFHNLCGYDSHLFVRKTLVVVMGVSIVFPTTKKSILASPKKKKKKQVGSYKKESKK